MAVIRTSRLFDVFALGGGYQLVYTCPPGYRAILRSLDCCYFGAVGDPVCYVETFAPNESVFFIADFVSGAPKSLHWSGTQVLDPGHLVKVLMPPIDFSFSGNGALLPLPSQELKELEGRGMPPPPSGIDETLLGKAIGL